MALDPARTHCRPTTNLFQNLKEPPTDDSSPRNFLRASLSLLGQSPAGLTTEQAGWMLNCQAHDIPALVNARLFKPLENPSQTGAKYLSTAYVLETAKGRAWLVKMSNAISHHWQHQNTKPVGDKMINALRAAI